MTDDGRTFFSTAESLVPARHQRRRATSMSSSTAAPSSSPPAPAPPPSAGRSLVAVDEVPGLVGVSANGTDVYFSTYDTLISEDHNGNFLKFYDARTNGGFPQPPPAQPCAAAEECHGPGTEAPALPTQGTAATLTGGNATPGSHKHHKKHHKRKSKRHNHRAARQPEGRK